MTKLDPIVHELLIIKAEQRWSNFQLCTETGLGRMTVHQLQQGHSPTLRKIVTIADFLGYELKLVKKGEG